MGRTAKPNLIPISEWARKVGVHRDTCRRWCTYGWVPGAFLLGSQWFVPPQSARPTASVTEDQGLTLAEAGRRANLTRERMRQVVNKGTVQAMVVKGHRYVVRQSFDEWLAKRAATQSPS